MVGLVEFIMHDVTLSETTQDEVVHVTMPDDEVELPLKHNLQHPQNSCQVSNGL